MKREALSSTSWPVVIPLALATLVFAHTVMFPFVHWDDPGHFSENPLAEHPLARGWSGLFWTREIGYPAPALLLSFALDRVLFGLSPAPYHAENVLFHLANVAMLYALAKRMRLTSLEACAVATLFAIHPLAAEPVSWVTGRKDMLGTALVFASAHIAAGHPHRDELRGAGRWMLVNVLLMISGLVLPRTVVAPLMVAILACAIRPGWAFPRVALRVAPALAFVLGVVALGSRQVMELGAVPPRKWADVPLDMAGAWALQLGHAVFPVDLLSWYFREPGDPPIWAMVISVLVAALAVAFALVQPSWRGAPFRTGVLLTLVAWAPVSCAFRIVRWTADSYMYLPMACLGLTLIPVIARAWPARLDRFGMCAAVSLAMVLAFLAFTTTNRYARETNLWVGAIARYPNEPLAYEQEALSLSIDGAVLPANVIFRQIAERFPDWQDTMDDEVRAYEAIGDVARAHQILARCVSIGLPTCVKMYILHLLVAPAPPPIGERDLVARAFALGFEPMKVGYPHADAFRRLADVLEAVGLTAEASAATAEATLLEGARASP